MAGTVLATYLVGWMEDVGARRVPQLWPLDSPGRERPPWRWVQLAAPIVVIVAVAALVPTAAPTSDEVAFRPRVPSQAPPRWRR